MFEQCKTMFSVSASCHMCFVINVINSNDLFVSQNNGLVFLYTNGFVVLLLFYLLF